MTATAGVILLYSLATLIAIAARRARVPYTAALLVTGVALGALHFVLLPRLTRELLFALFLPGLLFDASYRLRVRDLRESAWTVSALAVPGIAAAIFLTAAMLMVASHTFIVPSPVQWSTALVFGAVIAATDPVAVMSLLREVRAPRRLAILLEAESLLNDGTSIVFLSLVLAYIGGDAPDATHLVLSFARVAGGGALAGAIIGWVVSHAVRQIDDAAIEITLTTIAAYGSFVVAEQLRCSGVIATVVSGMMCGAAARQQAMSATTLAAVDSFWEWLAFALTSAVFILLGAEISLSDLAVHWPIIVIGALAALAGRTCVVMAVASVTGRREHIPASWQLVLSWGGLRGALSLVLALALPDTVPERSLIISITAGTVFLSLVGQGMTMSSVLRRLKIGIASA